jgi:predicted  nucleic acid-binding Zn-ribbon protein
VFAIVTGMGLWLVFRSQSKLKKIRDKKRMLREHQVAVIKSLKAADDLLGKIMILEEQEKYLP